MAAVDSLKTVLAARMGKKKADKFTVGELGTLLQAGYDDEGMLESAAPESLRELKPPLRAAQVDALLYHFKQGHAAGVRAGTAATGGPGVTSGGGGVAWFQAACLGLSTGAVLCWFLVGAEVVDTLRFGKAYLQRHDPYFKMAIGTVGPCTQLLTAMGRAVGPPIDSALGVCGRGAAPAGLLLALNKTARGFFLRFGKRLPHNGATTQLEEADRPAGGTSTAEGTNTAEGTPTAAESPAGSSGAASSPRTALQPC